MKENQRVRLSKQLLKNALIDLLQIKPLHKVSITEICEKAELNRTTFYKYYTDEYTLFTDIEKDISELIRKTLAENNGEALRIVLSVFKDNPKISKALFVNNTDDNFPQRLFSLPEIRQSMKQSVKREIDKDEFDKLSFFLYNGIYDLLKQWINNDFDTPVQDLLYFINFVADRLLS